MKKFTMFSNYLLLLAVTAIFALTSCDDDLLLNNEIPPSASITADAIASPGGTITLSITGNMGDGELNLLTITENGVDIDFPSRITSSDIAANPALLIGDNASAFSFIVEVEAPAVPDVYTYAAIVRDANGNTDVASTDVTVIMANPVPPTLDYMGPASFQISLENGTANSVFNLTGTPGNSDLTTIAVFENEELVNPSRLAFNGADFEFNPSTLSTDNVAGFDMADVLVRFTEGGVFNLRFELTDVNDETSTAEVTVEVEAGTAITDSFVASLLSNADGPADVLGGLDLDTGENVSVNSADADVIDLGLNDATGEWNQQIQGANGTTLRAADSSNPELFDFANINTREAIIAAFDSGISAMPSAVVQEGDVFIANRGGDYFIMTVTTIEVTPNDNEDFYLFDIKTSIQ